VTTPKKYVIQYQAQLDKFFEVGSLFREIFIKSKLDIWKTFSVMLPGNELCQEK